MNNTRKAIIELIEPYMIRESIFHADLCYDITAVLKRLLSNDDDYYYIETKYNYHHIFKWDENIWRTPNKPLHLFDTKEEEDLLNLLTKLKDENN